MQPDPFSSNSGQTPASQPFSTSQPNASPQPFSNVQPGDSSLSPAPIPSPDAASAGAPNAATDGSVAGEETLLAQLIKAHSSGANWFFWIVGLSLINAALISFGSDRVLAIGLNATMVMDYGIKDAIAKGAAHASGLRVVEMVFDFVVLAFYAFCGVMAMRGKVWAFYLGMTAFALDTLLSIIGVDIIGGLIHAWALFTMWQGAKALKQLNALRLAAQTPASPWAT